MYSQWLPPRKGFLQVESKRFEWKKKCQSFQRWERHWWVPTLRTSAWEWAQRAGSRMERFVSGRQIKKDRYLRNPWYHPKNHGDGEVSGEEDFEDYLKTKTQKIKDYDGIPGRPSCISIAGVPKQLLLKVAWLPTSVLRQFCPSSLLFRVRLSPRCWHQRM